MRSRQHASGLFTERTTSSSFRRQAPDDSAEVPVASSPAEADKACVLASLMGDLWLLQAVLKIGSMDS